MYVCIASDRLIQTTSYRKLRHLDSIVPCNCRPPFVVVYGCDRIGFQEAAMEAHTNIANTTTLWKSSKTLDCLGSLVVCWAKNENHSMRMVRTAHDKKESFQEVSRLALCLSLWSSSRRNYGRSSLCLVSSVRCTWRPTGKTVGMQKGQQRRAEKYKEEMCYY